LHDFDGRSRFSHVARGANGDQSRLG
jgi:hypothetical protein